MASTLVFVFLLDSAPDLNDVLYPFMDINTIIHKMNPAVQECDPIIADYIMKKVNNEMKLNISAGKFDLQSQMHVLPDFYNSIADGSKEYFMEKFQNMVDNKNNNKNADASECEKDNSSLMVVSNTSQSYFPRKAPFLVAIFETLSNVTAQTCAGTLLSPNWVLTAASCVNVLGNSINENVTIHPNRQYTVIAESSNPLIDGSVHRVIKVLLHPEPKHVHDQVLGLKMEHEPVLAMMRIEPGLSVKTLAMLNTKLTLDSDARVYGWTFVKTNDSSSGVLKAVSIAVQTRDASSCKDNLSFKPQLCLAANDGARNISQVSSGAPVVVVAGARAQVAGVTQTDERASLAAAPLYQHRTWIRNIISNTIDYT